MAGSIDEQRKETQNSQGMWAFAVDAPAAWEEVFSGIPERDTTVGEGVWRDRLDQAIRDLHSARGGHPWFQQALEAAQNGWPRESQPWGWRLLVDEPRIRVGLLTVYGFSRITLHDHPGSYGAQMVLSGRARIRQFDREDLSSGGKGLVALNKVNEQIISASETCVYTPSYGNIHDVAADSARCVSLNLILYPYVKEERGWYFPVNLLADGADRLLANRLQKRPSGAGITPNNAPGRSGEEEE